MSPFNAFTFIQGLETLPPQGWKDTAKMLTK